MTLGAGVKIGVGTVLGGDPQDLKYNGEPTIVEIGDGTTIREYTTINRGTTQSFKTTVGKNCFLMSYVHLAHDCHIGDGVIISNGTQLAGHVTIDEKAIVSGLVGVSPVRDDRPVQLHRRLLARGEGRAAVREGGRQSRSSCTASNSVGLERNGFPEDVRRELKRAYRLFFKSELNLSQARERAAAELQPFPEIQEFLAFFDRSDRGSVV